MAKTVVDQFAEILAAVGTKWISGIVGDNLNRLSDTIVRLTSSSHLARVSKRRSSMRCGTRGMSSETIPRPRPALVSGGEADRTKVQISTKGIQHGPQPCG
jgi:hypothetical protein